MSDNPFGGLFGDIFKILGQQGPDAWFETARTLGLNVARGADGDPNPAVAERQRLEQFAPLVARHLSTEFAISVASDVDAANRTQGTLAALDQWRPLIRPMLDVPAADFSDELGDAGATLGQLASTIGPLFTGFQLGSVGGHFFERAWSLATLPLPRDNDKRFLVVNNVAKFADEWSLGPDSAIVFALAREFIASVVLTQPGTSDALRALLHDAVTDAAAAQGDIMSRLSKMASPDEIASLMSNPESLLDGLEMADETPATRSMNAAAAVLRAFFDASAFHVTELILGPQPLLREAYLRYRLADARGEDAAAALFGIDNHGEFQTAADDFVQYIVATHGLAAFTALLRADGLPSHDEVTKPAEWFDRVSNSPLA